MKRIFTRSAAFLGLVCAAGLLTAQQTKSDAPPAGKPVEGTLVVGEHTYKLSHVVAYETKRDDETFISVVASDRKIPFDKIQAALRENEGSDDRLSLDQPYILITFRKSGEALWCKAAADGGSFTRPAELLSGKLNFANGRAKGECKLGPREGAALKSEFDVRWDVALGAEAARTAAKPAGPVKPSVTGTFKGNGKPAKLAFVSARPREDFSDKRCLMLIFTEKDHSKEKNPEFKAGFGEFGSALVISVFEDDGKIFGCEVAHAAHGKMPFSSVGNIRTSAFDAGDGKVEGEIQTDGEIKTFDKTWEVNLKFVAPYAAPPPKLAATSESTAAKKPGDKPGKVKPKKKPDPDDDDDDDDATVKDAAALNVKDLALPKDATDVAYKKLVGHMSFKSPTAVQALAGEFSKKLAEQGWKSDKSGDLVTAKSAILKRTRGTASLTIFVKPADKGSTVTIMTEGLDWDEKK